MISSTQHVDEPQNALLLTFWGRFPEDVCSNVNLQFHFKPRTASNNVLQSNSPRIKEVWFKHMETLVPLVLGAHMTVSLGSHDLWVFDGSSVLSLLAGLCLCTCPSGCWLLQSLSENGSTSTQLVPQKHLQQLQEVQRKICEDPSRLGSCPFHVHSLRWAWLLGACAWGGRQGPPTRGDGTGAQTDGIIVPKKGCPPRVLRASQVALSFGLVSSYRQRSCCDTDPEKRAICEL